jgi:uracil-DNA glycosylase family 4
VDTETLKSHLELCRRLGIRYVSLDAPGKEYVEPSPSVAPLAYSAEKLLAAPEEEKLPAGPAAQKPSGPDPDKPKWLTAFAESVQAMELLAFDRDICECQNCPLGKTRQHFVFGSGNPRAEVMFVGEAPGADEDAQGLPFVGKAGQLLTKIIESTKTWKRQDVFICNVLKCRPPGNRTPLPEEVEQCRPYLEEQIRIIKPKLIMALGASAAQALLKTKDSVGKLRNKWHEMEGVPLKVTYHPAALLRFDGYKKDVWADMKELTAKYAEITGKNPSV